MHRRGRALSENEHCRAMSGCYRTGCAVAALRALCQKRQEAESRSASASSIVPEVDALVLEPGIEMIKEGRADADAVMKSSLLLESMSGASGSSKSARRSTVVEVVAALPKSRTHRDRADHIRREALHSDAIVAIRSGRTRAAVEPCRDRGTASTA